MKTLQKWFPSTNKTINLFENQFPDTPLFYHSLSGSLYFFYVYKDKPGVYKLIDGSSTAVNVFNASGSGGNLNQLNTDCRGLYVTATGDVFVIDKGHHRVMKWVVNSTSGIRVAGNEDGSDPFELWTAKGLTVDETNNILYVLIGDLIVL